MLLGAKQTVEDFVIQILAQHGDYTVEDLKAIIAEQWTKNITLQGIYRVLRKLQADGIVVKERRFYSLRVPWILHVGEMLDRMEDTYLKEKFLVRYLPENEDDKYKWIFSSLIKLGDFYNQLLLAMIHAGKDKLIYQFYPHPWFNLPHLDQGEHFNKMFSEKTHHNYIVMSGSSFLDKYSTAQWELLKNLSYYHLKEGDKPFEKHPGRYVTVVDPYVLTITLDTHSTRRLENLYASITSSDDLKMDDIMKLFMEKVRARVVIERNPVVVKRYKKKFEKLFGPPPKRFPVE